MASSVWTSSLSLYLLLIVLFGISTSQTLSRFSNDIRTQQLLKKNWDPRIRSTDENLTKRLPHSRRFLFSPTIQNTITNLNHNSNLQEATLTEKSESKQSRSSANPRPDTVEYDIRGSRPKKICITFE